MENIGNFPENYYLKCSKIFRKNMKFYGKIFPPHITKQQLLHMR